LRHQLYSEAVIFSEHLPLELHFINDFTFETLILIWFKVVVAPELRVGVKLVSLLDPTSRCHPTLRIFPFLLNDVLHEVVVKPHEIFELKTNVALRLKPFAFVLFIFLPTAEKALVRLEERHYLFCG